MANVTDHLFRQAQARGDKVALICGDQTWTFAALAERVARIAGGLVAQGHGRGVHVGLMAPSRPEFVMFQQAVFMIGGALTPLNIFYKPEEIAHAVATCGLDMLIVDESYVGLLPDRLVTTEGADVAILVIGRAAPDGRLQGADALVGADPLGRPVDMTEDEVVMLLNTSATTGKAKGVMLTLGNVRANYDETPEWLGMDGDTVILCALPLYNTFALNQCINALMVTGGQLVMLDRFRPEDCLDAIETYRCTFFPAVPTMLQRMLDAPDIDRRDLTSMRRIMTGAAPVPAALLERIRAVMGQDTSVMTGYGLTEATAIVSLERIELGPDGKIERPKSIGRPVPGVEMAILGEDGQTMAAGEVGEICVRGPNVMAGYRNQPEATAEALANGWLHTGDIGVIDVEGHAFIVDRKKDVIIRGGQNIYPVDIEEVLYTCEGVREVAVVGESDESLGEVPVAYVAMAEGRQADVAAMLARCKDALAYYKVPRAVHVLPELPKGPTGKILRRGLRPMAVAKG